MKKMFTLLSAGALFAASAATLSTTSGTTFAGLTAGDAFSASGAAAEGGKYYWYSADAQSGTNMSLAANYYDGACGRPNQFAEAETSIALAVDAENLLYRAAEGSASAFSSPSFTQVDLGEDGLYIDTLIKFEQCRDEADIADDAGKLAVWLNFTSNLVITAGKYSGETFGTNDYVAAGLGDVQCGAFNPDAWYRLTVKAANSNGKVLFNVYIDGQQVTALDGGPITFFPSLQPSSLTLSALAFQGEGAVDDISFTEELPNFLFVGVAQIGDTSYATLDEALAAVNVGETIVLIADPGVTSVTLPKTGIALSDPNGYLSTVTGPNGQEITASENIYTLPLTAVNPVTGETENYTWSFVGTDTWNGTGNWRNSSGANPSGTPAKTGENTWEPILFDGSNININASMSVEGWNLRMGLYNGATVTMNSFVKYQGDTTMWMTVDEKSQLTVGGFGGGNITDNQVIKLSVAKTNGITWNVNLTSGNANNTFEYYLKGAGSVSNQAVSAANHKIKMADVTLSGNEKSVQSKTLVSFTSSTPTFTADAAIKVKNSSDEVVRTVNLSSVNSTGTTTLTTDNAVGMCELVQTTTGIVLFWVDGDPSDIKEYKPSININFTNGAGNGLTTSDDVGLEGYAVPGTSWNNFVVANNATFNTVSAIDSTGAASVASGVSVSISGTRGHWNCSNLTPASNLLHGYIDESAGGPTPTVTITGIPYEHYRVIVYHSTDQDGAKFGYDTINGFNFTYVDGVQQIGTTSWGSAGASNSAEPIAEGTNTLVSAVLSGDTVTMVAHRVGGGSPTARGCFAAIQVVQYVPEVGENDLVIEVSGPTTYTVSEERTLSGTVYVVGNGTLTLAGSEKITAATIDVAKDVVMNINADRLDATTFTGSGTVVYDATASVEGKGWANIGWSGTVWIKNQSVSSFEGTKFGNAASTVRFTGVTGFLQSSSWNGSPYVHTVPLELVDEGETVAFTYNNGWGGNLVKINTLKGTGTLKTQGSGLGEHIYIVDASGFTGAFNLTGKYVYVGGSQPDYSASANPNGKLEIRSGVTMTVPSGKTWTANGGFVVNGTLNVDGTLASSHTTKAVSGAGTVAFTGRAPTVSGDAWWKNADWTGTVQVKDVTNMVGDSRTGVWLKFNDYGNSSSVVELNNVTGWLETGYTCTVPLKVTGTLYLNNGGSGKASAFKVGTLLGSGAISGDGSAVTVVFNITDDWSGFTGTIGLNNKCVVFGETIPDTLTAGTIYVSEGAVVTPQQSSGTWWAVGGIQVDGELRAPNLDKFGGGTTITTTDNGVFTLTDSSNTDDKEVDYARITGTGTLRYADASGKWRALSKVNFPTNMICENNLSAGLILTTQGDNIIGSLAGSGQMRSDWGGSGNTGDRDLRILQAKDTIYSGVFSSSNDRVRDVYVEPGTSTAGTLTLSGTQTASNGLTVESGVAVNLTGTWVGATTVAGTFGGTGTLTGNLTFSDGATFKAFASDENGLSVSGTITYPSGTVTVDVSALGASAKKVVLLTAASESDIDLTKFALADGTPSKYKLAKEGATLVLKGARKGVFIGVY